MIQRSMLALFALLMSQTLFALQIQPRIVGGSDANIKWHTVVALISKERIAMAIENNWPSPIFQARFCGGTLLSEDWVMTAAHCVDGLNPSEIYVMVGSQTLDIPVDSNMLKDISEININPTYNSLTYRNDVALIRLSDKANPALASVNTAVLALNETDMMLENALDYDDIFTALGWGVVTYEQRDEDPELDPVYPANLQQVTLDYVTNSQCQFLYDDSIGGTISNTMLCANEPAPDAEDTFGEDTCRGDSGGPLFITSNSLDDSPQAGITSFGGDCGNPLVPGVYTRVSQFLDWIEVTSSVTGIELRNLSIGEDSGLNQGINSFPVTIPVTNKSSLKATNFTLAIKHSEGLTLTPNEPGLNCNTPNVQLTECVYTGDAILANSTKELNFTITDTSSRSNGTEDLQVTVSLDKHRDYHRLDNSGVVTLYFGEPILDISAAPICLTQGGASSQMRVELSLSNNSNQIDSLDTVVTANLPESLNLIGSASPGCQLNNGELSCDIGTVDAEGNVNTTISINAGPATQTSVTLNIANENGLAVGSSPTIVADLDFTREDLPTCPAIPAPVSNLTSTASSGSSGSGGGGAPGVVLLGLLALWGFYRKH